MSYRVAVDIGGTFTDVVAFDEETGALTVGKTLSTPHDLVDGIADGLAAAGPDPSEVALVVHGSTVVINALIERRGARLALLTTEGFRDVYGIGRVNRPDAFDLGFRQHEPLVPRERVFEVPERLRADGRVHRPLDEDAVRALAVELARDGIEAVAVVLLHSWCDPVHERRVGEILRAALPGVYITLSHELSREYREFERTSTTAANAYVGPVVSGYLDRLESRLVAAGADAQLAVMQSNGGLTDVATAARMPVQMTESGPAGGVVATIDVCRAIGRPDAIAFDMGGTTAKAAVVQELAAAPAAEYFVGGYATGLPLRIPVIDIVEVGTGGGSLAWIDEAGGLHVGPRSAGADPGPACYGRGGTDATVTDACVVLGQLDPDAPLSGGLVLDPAAAARAVGAVGDRVGLSVEAAARGIVAIAAAAMADAIRAVTTERGLDPRDFALFAYGGNGPLHISLVARELSVRDVVVPRFPAVFSALGMLTADVRHDVVHTGITRLDALPAAELDARLTALEHECAAAVVDGRIDHAELTYARAADMRYVGQEHSLLVDVPPLAGSTADLEAAFHAAHLLRFGHHAPAEPVQIVGLRVSAIGRRSRPDAEKLEPAGVAPPPVRAERVVWFDAAVPCPVYDRSALLAGHRIAGPAVVEEGTSTTLLRPGDSLEVDPYGNLLLTIGDTAPPPTSITAPVPAATPDEEHSA